MRTVVIQPTLISWRGKARDLLMAKISPDEVLWNDGSGTPPLFADEIPPPESGSAPTIPRSFFDLAQLVACNREPQRWAMLYEVAFRIAIGGEPHLMNLATDPLIRSLTRLGKNVSRDRHKMKAFVRFQKAADLPNGREQFIAWFEPDHHIVELTSTFFAKRFTSFNWSILTPDRCAHWDGEAVTFSEGIKAKDAPTIGDDLENYWKTYYASIFNPARLKLKAMQSEMPKKYWKNLPEAELIAQLTSQATHRTEQMIARPPTRKSSMRD